MEPEPTSDDGARILLVCFTVGLALWLAYAGGLKFLGGG